MLTVTQSLPCFKTSIEPPEVSLTDAINTLKFCVLSYKSPQASFCCSRKENRQSNA